jgi:hypothetical protein
VTHTNTCTNCHTNTGNDGRLAAGTNGTAADHTIGTTSTCANCHDDGTNFEYATKFGDLGTGHKVQDHTGVTGVANCTTTCHLGSPPVSNIIFFTHSACTNCHNNTGNDGTLQSRSNGDASGGSGDCVSCHENGGTLTYSRS